MATLVATLANASVQYPQAAFLPDATVAPIQPEADLTPINLEDHMGMVRSVARRLHRTLPSHIELDDLISAGYLGLVDAAQKFEQSRQTQFRSYAEFRVRGAILDSLRELDWGTRSLRRKVRDIEQARNTLATTLGHAPEDIELASELGISVADLRDTLSEARSLETESLQAESDDEDGQDLLASIVDPKAKSALSLCLESEFKQNLVDAIESLPERERLIITLSYYEELTLKEIGDMLSLTVSRVSQIRTSAVVRLRRALTSTR